jgi:uncharacterized protein
MPQPNLQPVAVTERAAILDILRGFALLGVFIDNSFGFTGYSFFTHDMRQSLSTAIPDAVLALSELTFVHGKFYSLFSLLFGIGFSVILLRSQARGVNAIALFYRRLFVLMLIGAFHIRFMWEGDILFLYALLGMLLPLFRKCSDRTLLIWSAALILSPILVDIIKVAFNFRTGGYLELLAQKADTKNGIPLDKSYATYLFDRGSGWGDWRRWLESGYLYRFAYIIESNRIPKVLGMFLLGFYVGRKMMYANLAEYIPLLKRIRFWGFLIGIPVAIATTWFEIDDKAVPHPLGLLDTVSYAFSVVPLCLAYTASICLLWVRSNHTARIKVLAPVGQMALTNYLLQTLMGIFIFYGVGLSWGGYIGPTIFFPIIILLYCLQVAYSHWWMKRFNYGPVEWLWRQMTYGKRLKLRRSLSTGI